MKSKHHLITTLMANGVAEQRAVYLAGKIFNAENPRADLKARHDALDAEVTQKAGEQQALKKALATWDADRRDATHDDPPHAPEPALR